MYKYLCLRNKICSALECLRMRVLEYYNTFVVLSCLGLFGMDLHIHSGFCVFDKAQTKLHPNCFVLHFISKGCVDQRLWSSFTCQYTKIVWHLVCVYARQHLSHHFLNIGWGTLGFPKCFRVDRCWSEVDSVADVWWLCTVVVVASLVLYWRSHLCHRRTRESDIIWVKRVCSPCLLLHVYKNTKTYTIFLLCRLTAVFSLINIMMSLNAILMFMPRSASGVNIHLFK